MPVPATFPASADRPLHPHPADAAPVLALHANVGADRALLHLRYTLAGHLAQVRVPAPLAEPATRPSDGLWRHTCFELFVAAPEGPGYTEWNFAPSGAWAAYRFRAERERAANAGPLPAPRLACRADARELVLDVWLPRAALGAGATQQPGMGLTAVIEAPDGALTYWALHHPGARPDFHHRAGWTARLSPDPTPPHETRP